MNTPLIASPSPLDLLAARRHRDNLATLLRAERTAAADFLLALADFDRRRGWEPLGHATLFAFLRSELRLSSGAAFWRMSAARLLQRFPEVIEPLRDGRLCLSTTAEVAKVLTDESRADLLPRFFGLSAREAKELVAELQPREAPATRVVVTRVASQEALPSHGVTPPQLKLAPAPTPNPNPYVVPPSQLRTSEVEFGGASRSGAKRDDVEPLTADLRRLHVTVGRQFLKKLDAARDGLSHVLPGATTEQVLEAALDLLLEKQARARGLVKRPRKAVEPAATSTETPACSTPNASLAEPVHRREGPREAIPAAVRRAVWERDQGTCAWPLDGGGCCGSAHRLQLDHLVPWAQGGRSTAENLRLTCERHNRLAARLAFGARCVGRYAGAT